jgi:hypothetical protein
VRRACRAHPGCGTVRLRVFDFPTAAVIYCTIVGLAFLGLWLWYDRRDRQRFELERGRTTFHCIRCDALYTAPAGTTLCKCPKCGHENSRLRF